LNHYQQNKPIFLKGSCLDNKKSGKVKPSAGRVASKRRKKMVTNMVIFLTVLVYGVNFLVYMYLKINHIKDYLEKIAIYFGTNMTLLFTSGIFLFFGKIVEDGILVFE
jgi:CRISPR/Cas system-associated protein Csx1